MNNEEKINKAFETILTEIKNDFETRLFNEPAFFNAMEEASLKHQGSK